MKVKHVHLIWRPVQWKTERSLDLHQKFDSTFWLEIEVKVDQNALFPQEHFLTPDQICVARNMVLLRTLRSPVSSKLLYRIRSDKTKFVFAAAQKRFNSNVSTIEDGDPIHRVDLRVGKIAEVSMHPDAEHLYIEKG